MGRRLVGDGDRGEERWEGLTLLFGLSGEYDLSRRAIGGMKVEDEGGSGQAGVRLGQDEEGVVCAWL